MRTRPSNLTFLSTLAALLVAGCASQQVEKGLQAMVGQPIQAAFGILGYPEGKQSFGNDDVYIWSHERTGGMLMPQVATTYQTYGSQSLYGTVGRTPVYANVSPQTVTSSTLYNQYVPMNAQFRIKLGADAKSGIIKNWQWEGNEMGAQAFAGALGAYAKSRNTPATFQATDNPFVQNLRAKKLNKETLARVAAGRVIGVQDIHNLLRSGLPNEEIIAYLKATKTPYSLNATQLSALRRSGADGNLIAYLEKANGMHSSGRGNELMHPYYNEPQYSGPPPFRFVWPAT